MAAFRIKGEDDIPSVTLDRDNNIFEISGRSLPEETMLFYRPILNWLDNYAHNPLPRTEFVFDMNYYNTASAKQILEILLKLEDIYCMGHDVRVTWLYENGDFDMEDAGVEYARIVNVPIVMATRETAMKHAANGQDANTGAQEFAKNETFIVTIGRELGAGGRVVGRLLAEKLRINYFDYAVIEALATQYDDDSDIVKEVNNDNKNTWWKNIRDLIKSNMGKSREQNETTTHSLTDKQQEILNRIARNESCIVAGQSAFYIFRDYPNHINIFICASDENRISKLMTREGITRNEAIDIINRVSMERDMYVVENTGMPRHDTRNSDLVINMDNISEEDAVNIIISYIETRKKYFALLVDND
ncbi:MAG: SiaC family regulatory phosphoprotein [Bacteroidales bacterium]|nr:SiaC family regulatory phosphoprotein [Bacteroidales bacterium]